MLRNLVLALQGRPGHHGSGRVTGTYPGTYPSHPGVLEISEGKVPFDRNIVGYMKQQSDIGLCLKQIAMKNLDFLLYLVVRHLRTNPLEMCGSCCFTLKQTAYRMAVLFDTIVAEV